MPRLVGHSIKLYSKQSDSDTGTDSLGEIEMLAMYLTDASARFRKNLTSRLAKQIGVNIRSVLCSIRLPHNAIELWLTCYQQAIPGYFSYSQSILMLFRLVKNADMHQ